MLAVVVLLLAAGCFAKDAAAQYGSVRGIVFDADLRDELPGATIILGAVEREKKIKRLCRSV